MRGGVVRRRAKRWFGVECTYVCTLGQIRGAMMRCGVMHVVRELYRFAAKCS